MSNQDCTHRETLYAIEGHDMLHNDLDALADDVRSDWCDDGPMDVTLTIEGYERDRVCSRLMVKGAFDCLDEMLADEYSDEDGELINPMDYSAEIAAMTKRIDSELTSWRCSPTGKEFKIRITDDDCEVVG